MDKVPLCVVSKWALNCQINFIQSVTCLLFLDINFVLYDHSMHNI